MDKFIEILKLITNGGRKLTAIIWTELLLAILGETQILILKTEPTIDYIVMAGVAGFFFGVNILGDHILGGKDNFKNER